MSEMGSGAGPGGKDDRSANEAASSDGEAGRTARDAAKTKEERLAEALRANLRRRKSAAKARKSTD